ncbi:2Fe-2S iron-sulfur cluster-binding protein [Zavarzinia compransoris]|uniref:Ferredoxin n=1 Tax=Zavarzinia compransoris TaxID=1264899 RepID=A0A317E7P8_9PROT|nr:2Fe-2S iron-sulfur cluster binding domain-containing protein [Zavarzinia compransoris]PWR23158.1 ferredoxin [Zavarzinia compransoris]TDP46285.1 2Fe-2S iron-sulfur cluster protein [Zavarzinia compransoris]
MSGHRITITDTGEEFPCADSQSVLDGMVRLGRRGIPAGCRGGGCGVCKIEVLEGTFTPEVMSRAHVSEDDLRQGRVLACRIRPEGDLCIRVIGKMTRAWGLPGR